MTAEGARPQDVDRKHRRAGRPSPATSALLVRYQAAMRADLERILVELAGTTDPQLQLDGKPAVKVPTLVERTRLWELAIKLGRELGTEIDATAAPGEAPAAPAAPRRSRRAVDYG